MRQFPAILLLLAATPVYAASGQSNSAAILCFFLFVGATLLITAYAAKRTRSVDQFYTAEKSITGFQNGLAIAGDFMSAATLLGVSGLMFLFGMDGVAYSIGSVMGWPVIMILLAGPLRRLGRYNFSDILSWRLRRRPILLLSSLTGLFVIALYLLAQIVGAGHLIEILFGLPYWIAVLAIGVLMCVYVSFGGMLATTWVQIVKAVLLLFGGLLMTLMVLSEFDFSLAAVFERAVESHPRGEQLFTPMLPEFGHPLLILSFVLTFLFGPAGMPHLLMRFFTVPDEKAARRSVFYATCVIGAFQIIIFILGFASISLLLAKPELFSDGKLIGGQNMAVIQLARVVGGDVFFGFMAAITFATILAVVAGLTIAAVSSIVNDLYAGCISKGEVDPKKKLLLSRLAPIAIAMVAVALALAFSKHNVAVLATVALATGAGVNFPLLFLAVTWKGLTTRGAVVGGLVGLLLAIVLVVTGPLVWTKVLGYEQALHPLKFPTIVVLPCTMILTWLVSILDNSADAATERLAFEKQFRHLHLEEKT